MVLVQVLATENRRFVAVIMSLKTGFSAKPYQVHLGAKRAQVRVERSSNNQKKARIRFFRSAPKPDLAVHCAENSKANCIYVRSGV